MSPEVFNSRRDTVVGADVVGRLIEGAVEKSIGDVKRILKSDENDIAA